MNFFGCHILFDKEFYGMMHDDWQNTEVIIIPGHYRPGPCNTCYKAIVVSREGLPGTPVNLRRGLITT